MNFTSNNYLIILPNYFIKYLRKKNDFFIILKVHRN